MGKWQSKQGLMELTKSLVRCGSVSGSEEEIIMANEIYQYLGELTYFQEHQDYLNLHQTSDGRKFVSALVKAEEETAETVVLLSHFDVVDVVDYGKWQDIAFHPDELTQRFYQHKDELPKHVRADMESGNWLFGRGMMDMKAGLAAEMAMIEQAATGAFSGNLLLVTVPDEEVDSVGMREAVPVLTELAEQWDLAYKACINTEPMFSQFPGDERLYLYTGTIGKVLPGFYCYGKATHVGEPFSGLNANLMSSYLTNALELNASFRETILGEKTPPPTNLMQKDLKTGYSVQVPDKSVTLFNLIVMQRSLAEITLHLKQVAEEATKEIQAHVLQRLNCDKGDGADVTIRVYTYQELFKQAVLTYGQQEVEQQVVEVIERHIEKDDRERTIIVLDHLATLCQHLAPMVVLFYAPPYYPARSSRQDPLIEKVRKEVTHYAKATHQLTLNHQIYFPGMSDLSYTGFDNSDEELAQFVDNMPLWQKGYDLPMEQLKQLNIPIMNIGPCGRDAHQWTERLEIDYSFVVFPDLLTKAIKQLLK